MAASSTATRGRRRPRRRGRKGRFSVLLGLWETAAGAKLGRTERRRLAQWNVAAVLCLIVVGGFRVWTGQEVSRLAYALSDARVLEQKLVQELDELRIEHAAATGPDVLWEEARRRLAMGTPEPGQVVVLR